MNDRKSVVTHLQIIHTWTSFARERDLQFFTAKHLEDIAQWTEDAIAMLKEQEEQLSIKTENFNRLVAKVDVMPKIVRCENCENNIGGRCRNLDLWVETDPNWFCADGKRRERR